MDAMKINMVAILITVVANFFLGFLWYTPLFGKAWAKEMGFDTSVKPPAGALIKGMVFMIIGNFFLAFVFAHNIKAWSFVPGVEKLSTIGNIMNATVFTWLGFYLPVDLSTVAWESKSWKLFFINTAYHFITLLLTASILVLMN